MSNKASLFLFRNDLRLGDNPGLTAAAQDGPLVCVYILDEEPAFRSLGGASRWWLYKSLAALGASLNALGCELILQRGNAAEVLPRLCASLGIGFVHWNRRYDQASIDRDTQIKADLTRAEVLVQSHKASLLVEPWEVKTKTGGQYKVFSPFWKAIRANLQPGDSLPVPSLKAAKFPDGHVLSDTLEDWNLLPHSPDWSGGFGTVWVPGEQGAQDKLATFITEGLAGYAELRNRPDMEKISRLSPHLRFGEISPRQTWNTVSALGDQYGAWKDRDSFLSEIVWREFSYQLLHHAPDLPNTSWKPAFEAYPWREDPAGLAAWQRGETGYPIVDAGMRQLWHTGWMHNRVRMIVASFLIKHLGVHWREGEAWFWDTLVDADLASNSASWQWVAGSGADAAPYFRVFNPITQGVKFDPKAEYIRQWVPELRRVPDKYIFAPWEAPAEHMRAFDVEMGRDYPKPIVDHGQARARALAGYQDVKAASAVG